MDCVKVIGGLVIAIVIVFMFGLGVEILDNKCREINSRHLYNIEVYGATGDQISTWISKGKPNVWCNGTMLEFTDIDNNQIKVSQGIYVIASYDKNEN